MSIMPLINQHTQQQQQWNRKERKKKYRPTEQVTIKEKGKYEDITAFPYYKAKYEHGVIKWILCKNSVAIYFGVFNCFCLIISLSNCQTRILGYFGIIRLNSYYHFKVIADKW